MISCKRCGSREKIKSGFQNGKQRYKCKSCNRYFVERDDREKYSFEDKLRALRLYKRGLSLRSIAEFIGTNNVTIFHWIRNFGKDLKEHIVNLDLNILGSEIIEIDEMWHYCQKNEKNFGFGLLFHEPEGKLLLLNLALEEEKL
ncbi:MAG: helix-turn-helix domain-containing protein [Candidatus Caenarcaniphilales bacterium]|nr:helix-turn-helix domain-containing protein [Candidatus Caenarcaniphilales bacterium]